MKNTGLCNYELEDNTANILKLVFFVFTFACMLYGTFWQILCKMQKIVFIVFLLTQTFVKIGLFVIQLLLSGRSYLGSNRLCNFILRILHELIDFGSSVRQPTAFCLNVLGSNPVNPLSLGF